MGNNLKPYYNKVILMGRKIEIQQIDIELMLKAFALEEGEKLYVQVYSKTEGGMRQRELIKAKMYMARLYPDECSTIRIRQIKKDGKFYVFLEQDGKSPLLAYQSLNSGKYKPVRMTPDADRERRIKLMIEDGLTKEQILEIEGEAARKYFDSF